MTDEEMERLEALAQAATPGPWRWEAGRDTTELDRLRGAGDVLVLHFGDNEQYYPSPGHEPDDPDKDFIAAAREAVPALVAEVRSLRAHGKKVEGWLHAAHEDIARRVDRNDRPCPHITLRPAHLPCPHPDCWTGPSRAFFPDPQKPVSYACAPMTTMPEPIAGRYYARESIDMRDRRRPEVPMDLWGWVPD